MLTASPKSFLFTLKTASPYHPTTSSLKAEGVVLSEHKDRERKIGVFRCKKAIDCKFHRFVCCMRRIRFPKLG